MIKRGVDACLLTGIPELHAEAFQEVANQTRCMISSRAVGKYATGLILEGYSSKGFHNKAKSCNWGPMAGFVLNDPRFTKVGGSAEGQKGQSKALNQAFGCGAVGVPLFISDERRKWLEKTRVVSTNYASGNVRHYKSASPWGTLMRFTLKLERPPGQPADMWGVYYHALESGSAKEQQQKYSGESESGLYYVMAMRDPHCELRLTDPKAATTGDYDLFAIYARKGNYDPDGLDKRMVGVRQLETNIKAGLDDVGEDPHEGNKTARIDQIKKLLNEGIRRRGYTGGQMVHHSDEGGRPFVEDVDLPVFAVLPFKGSPYGIESVDDFRQFISVDLAGFAPVFNPGWMRQLVPTAGLIKAHFKASGDHSPLAKGPLHRELLSKTPKQD